MIPVARYEAPTLASGESQLLIIAEAISAALVGAYRVYARPPCDLGYLRR